MYATLTTTKGTTEDMLGTARVVGDALHSWLGAVDAEVQETRGYEVAFAEPAALSERVGRA